MLNRYPHIASMSYQELRNYLPTAFDNELTLLQKINKAMGIINIVVERMNDLSDLTIDELNKQNKKIADLYQDFQDLKDWLESDGLTEHLTIILNEWFDNGKLAEVINEQVFNMKANQAEVNELRRLINSNTASVAYLDRTKMSRNDVIGIIGDTASGQPLFAPNVAGMTNQNRLYVNGTNGYIYAYIDGAWTNTNQLYNSIAFDMKWVFEGMTRGTLDAERPLDAMTTRADNGYWTIASANTNPGLPATPNVPAKLTVENSLNDSYQRIDFRAGGGSFWRNGSLGTWSRWQRISNTFNYEGSPPERIVDLNQMRPIEYFGFWRIFQNRNFLNLPDTLAGNWNAGSLMNFTDGQSTCVQFLTINFQAGGVVTYTRSQTGPSGNFTKWVPLGDNNDGSEIPVDVDELEGRVDILEAMAGIPKTTFEVYGRFTSYWAGESYMDLLRRNFNTKVRILNLGESTRGRPIRAFEMGDATKPTYYIMCAQHGDEPMGREVAYLWVRELCESNDAKLQTFLQNYCLVVVPTVNADEINRQRLSSTGTDLNRNWETKTTKEIQAVSSVFNTHNVVLTIDAHEGGKWETFEADWATAPEVNAGIRQASENLFKSLESSFDDADEVFARYAGDTTLTTARNIIANEYKSSTMVLEGSSLLAQNMYAPSISYRRQAYLLAYRSIMSYVMDNMNTFVQAKNNA